MTGARGEAPDGTGGADAFAVLGLAYSPDLTDADVRAAYLLRLRAVHPDNGGDPQAAAAVTAAYDALRSGFRRGELLTAVTTSRGSGGPPPRRRPGRPRASGPATGRAGERTRPGTGRVPDAARRAELRRQVAAQRAEQGLPPYITDAATLDKIADLLVVTLGRGDAAQRAHPRPLSAAGPRQRPGAVAPRELSAWRRESRRRYAQEREEREAAAAVPPAVNGPVLVRAWLRVRHGRPWWLAARVAVAAGVVAVAQVAAPGDPAVPALGVGAVTWLARTARYDLAPRPRR